MTTEINTIPATTTTGITAKEIGSLISSGMEEKRTNLKSVITSEITEVVKEAIASATGSETDWYMGFKPREEGFAFYVTLLNKGEDLGGIHVERKLSLGNSPGAWDFLQEEFPFGDKRRRISSK